MLGRADSADSKSSRSPPPTKMELEETMTEKQLERSSRKPEPHKIRQHGINRRQNQGIKLLFCLGPKNDHKHFAQAFRTLQGAGDIPAKLWDALKSLFCLDSEGENKSFQPHPFAWKTPIPRDSLQIQRDSLSAVFSCLQVECHIKTLSVTSKLHNKAYVTAPDAARK